MRRRVMEVIKKAELAYRAVRQWQKLNSHNKNQVLHTMAAKLIENIDSIVEENQKDTEAAQAQGISGALLDRLKLTEARIKNMAEGLNAVSLLSDPIGEVVAGEVLANGLKLQQVRVPLGVIGIIYESRPNVTADAAGLCLKSGNAVILRGGSEAINSNRIIVQVLRQALIEHDLTPDILQIIENTDRSEVMQMMRLNQYIDVIIPRGGYGLIQTVVQNSTVPVIETGVGNCHIFVDESADLQTACDIVKNAKVQRPGVCNALETVLIHQNIAGELLPRLAKILIKEGVELRGCNRTRKALTDIKQASKEDWQTEFLDLILAIKVVDSLQEAIDHINCFGTKHSEAIITESYCNSQTFLDEVDAAAVYVNASTRFTDGFQFGMGAEIGISTQKLHARGPMGLQELTTTKYIIYGQGDIRP